ncbi:MBL fold metallo-hydrolase [Deinococcus frigens]|uniref:MBL fold metallo-hydrolase n=1 Tax=Deinococcus frigens TaxID=249403 RepID=UPI000AF44A55|nr:MBL fold metallo-hydrolase [Deinococcus frigens]
MIRFQQRFLTGPGDLVNRPLLEGDDVAGFTVIETPGHTPGHASFFRERDRVLIQGDVLRNTNMTNLQPGLAEPLGLFTVNPALNRASARKVAALKPSLILFGHGSPEYDGGRFQEFVARLAG